MSVIGLLGGLKFLLKRDQFVSDNVVFQLHYRLTCTILVGCSILVSAYQYFGEPIACLPVDGGKDQTQKVMETYCWTHATFSVVKAWSKPIGPFVRDGVVYPGVENSANAKGDELVYHGYYQWVGFLLFGWACFYYVPHYIWKSYHGNRLAQLQMDLDSTLMPQKDRKEKCEVLVKFFNLNRGSNGSLLFLFVTMEILNLINVIMSIYVIDRFLGNAFWKLGWKVLAFDDWGDGELKDNPLIRIFPRITKCIFHKYGNSGDVTRLDTMCLLPINNVNEKIFLFLWFWFLILAALTTLAIIGRLITLINPGIRVAMTQVRCRMARPSAIEMVVSGLPAGDWFVIDLLAKNMSQVNFAFFIELFHQHMDCHCKGHGCARCSPSKNNNETESNF
ncbi:Innexin inx2 [Halotydeus destructor]|nr:Innexin inx2 [Halotydeus destructor]